MDEPCLGLKMSNEAQRAGPELQCPGLKLTLGDGVMDTHIGLSAVHSVDLNWPMADGSTR